jgi:hypothetical protein
VFGAEKKKKQEIQAMILAKCDQVEANATDVHTKKT